MRGPARSVQPTPANPSLRRRPAAACFAFHCPDNTKSKQSFAAACGYCIQANGSCDNHKFPVPSYLARLPSRTPSRPLENQRRRPARLSQPLPYLMSNCPNRLARPDQVSYSPSVADGTLHCPFPVAFFVGQTDTDSHQDGICEHRRCCFEKNSPSNGMITRGSASKLVQHCLIDATSKSTKGRWGPQVCRKPELQSAWMPVIQFGRDPGTNPGLLLALCRRHGTYRFLFSFHLLLFQPLQPATVTGLRRLSQPAPSGLAPTIQPKLIRISLI